MHHGVDRTAAIVDAGRKRARPIIMTTIAMAAGMAPSALAIGAGGDVRAPMAIAVIGGLPASTALSLLFVPTVFTLFDDIGRLSGRVFGRFFGKADEPVRPAIRRRRPRRRESRRRPHANATPRRPRPDGAGNERQESYGQSYRPPTGGAASRH